VFESCSKYCIAVPLLVLYRLLVLGKSGCLLLRCFLKRITGFSLYHVFVSSMIFHSLPIWRFFTVIRKKKQHRSGTFLHQMDMNFILFLKKDQIIKISLKEGLEPPTLWLTATRSNQLSYSSFCSRINISYIS
jgi:hypothetical protein